jgi:alpha-amylase
MGFTALWISPVSKNYENSTVYGDAWHGMHFRTSVSSDFEMRVFPGYWVTDISQLNDHFGTSEDLKALSNELHARGM